MSSDRSRREVKTRGHDAQRLGALEQLKRARQGGQAAIIEQPVTTTNESDEDEDDCQSDSENYEDIKSSIKRKASHSHQLDSKRLKKKQYHSDEDDDDDDEQQTKSSEPKRRGQVLAKPQDETVGATKDIKSMFAATKTRTVQRQEQNQKDDSDKLLSDIMCELQKPKSKTTRSIPQPPAKVESRPIPPPPPPASISKPIEISTSQKSNSTPVLTRLPDPSPVPREEKALDWGDDDSMSFDAVSKFMNETAPPTKSQSPPRVSKSLIQFDTQELEFVTDEQLLKSSRTFHTETDQNGIVNTDNKDEHLRFFWFDAYEDSVAQPGKLFLFGKTPLLNEDKSSNKTFVSVCLIIDNIPKQVFFLPRTGSSASDVEDELFIIAKRFKITNYTSTIVKKKRFDPDLTAIDILNEIDYVEMKYPARCASLPSDLQGDTFQCVFGTNQQALEYVLIEKKLKGPSWLNITNCAPVKTRRSWCKLEYDVDYYNGIDRQITNINISTTNSPPPPLVAVTLSLVTLPNTRTHETEVICVAGLVHQQFPLDSGAPKRPYQNYFVALTKPSDCILPTGLAKAAESQKIKIETVPSERALLMYLISKFQLLDPDVIIGHDMRMFGLELFLSRCQKLKVGLTASKISRLHRTHDGKTKISAIKNPTCGRLLCDISVSARELLTKCKSYDLEELCKTVLNTEQQQLYRTYSIDQTRDAFSSSMSVVDLVQATLNNTSLTLNIFCQLMALPLAYQLTCIAGNLLSRTLMGGRSERNDHLLLHAFTEKDYIVPERAFVSNHRAPIKPTQDTHHESDEEVDDDTKKATKATSASYTGGLVLAPKKGFYDRFILLLDFNSLYPSIIQEFNVCFTTYMKKPIQTRSTNTEQEPAEVDDIVALDETTKGILPLEIYKLVERRREVKKLIKEKKNLSDEQLIQYDIRQKAYKLTANSLYGCLGFKYSRFFCKQLAAFITYKGRELLMQAKNIVERMNYDVIYGDTDSIMINTNSTDYDQVMAIGAKIRNEINRQYKNIEIGIDGVFKCMLLLKKKKYAALIVEKTATQEFTYKTELKGLDIVRRDWCQLARTVGEFIVSVILSGQSRDDVLDIIHNRLRDLGDEMRAAKISIEEYEINRQLSKDPSDYSDAKSLPHVQIAARFNKNSTGRKMKRGDTIAYIVCEDGTQNSAMQRGYLREEISASSSSLTIDINYYLHQQILPVISRLLEPFDGTDQALLAQCLGLDSSKYKKSQNKQYASKDDENNGDNNDADDLDNELLLGEGSEAFKQCDPFVFSCPQCQTLNFWKTPFIFNEDKTCISPLLRCTNVNCSTQPIDHLSYLRNRLTLMINKAIRRYYQNWLRCEDDTCCAFRTRQTPLEVLYNRHTCTSCGKSELIREYDDRQLNLQLQFLKQLFNLDAYKQSLNRTKLEQIDVYLKSLSVDIIRSVYKTMNDLQAHIDRIVQKSGYAEVCISTLFAQFYFNN